jgi:hypothetical protein
MKRMFVIIPALAVLLGASDVAFAKHHKTSLKKPDTQDDQGRKVPCLVHGVQQMVRTEDVCKDFNGTVVTGKSPQEATAVSKEKIAEQKNGGTKNTKQIDRP